MPLTKYLFKGTRTPISDVLVTHEKDLDKVIDKKYTVGGWIRTCRFQSELSFIHINDGSCFGCLQIILNDEFIDTSKCKTGLYIIATGKLVKSPAKGQLVEIVAEELNVPGKTYATPVMFIK